MVPQNPRFIIQFSDIVNDRNTRLFQSPRVTESRHHPNVRMHSDKIHNIVKLDIYNTHHIELQPRPRDYNESILINQVVVLTLARTRDITDIVIQATVNTHHIELQPR